jgi:hypothetical protein
MTRRISGKIPSVPLREASTLIQPAFAAGGPPAGKAPLCQNCALACGASTFLPVSVVIAIEDANVAAPHLRRLARYETYSNNERMTAAPTPQGRTTMKSLNFLTHQEIFDRAVSHLDGQGRAALLPRGGGAYRGYCGGCPVGSFIKPRDYMTAMEGIPVRYIGKTPVEVPAYMDVGIAALKKVLLRAHQYLRSGHGRSAQLPAKRARRIRPLGMAGAVGIDRPPVRGVRRAGEKRGLTV